MEWYGMGSDCKIPYRYQISAIRLCDCFVMLKQNASELSERSDTDTNYRLGIHE